MIVPESVDSLERESMTYRFDMKQKTMGALMAVLLVVSLIVPACMTLICLEAPMSGAMDGMSISDCLAAGAAHDGLLATDASALSAMVLVFALFGAAMAVRFTAPLAQVGWVFAPNDTSPPPPLDPRGERLLV